MTTDVSGRSAEEALERELDELRERIAATSASKADTTAELEAIGRELLRLVERLRRERGDS